MFWLRNKKNNFLYWLLPRGLSLGLVTRLEVIKLFPCSTQLSMQFQLLIRAKMLKIKTFLPLKLSDGVFVMLINVKMPTIVGILLFMSMINFMLS